MISLIKDIYYKIKTKLCIPKRKNNLSKQLLKRTDSIFDL